MTNSDLINLGDEIRSIVSQFDPEDFFDEKALEEWARNNDFVKEDEIQ